MISTKVKIQDFYEIIPFLMLVPTKLDYLNPSLNDYLSNVEKTSRCNSHPANIIKKSLKSRLQERFLKKIPRL